MRPDVGNSPESDVFGPELQRHGNPLALGAELAQRLRHNQKISLFVATDGTAHTQHALRLAAGLSRSLNAELKILVTVRGRTGTAHAQHVMLATQRLTRELNLRSELIPLVGPADEVLAAYIEQNRADLLVLGAFKDRGPGGLADIGTTAQNLVRYAPMSVLVAKGEWPRIGSVLAAVSPKDASVVDVSIPLAQRIGAKLHVLHAVAPPPEVPSAWSVTNEMPLDEILARGVYRQTPHISASAPESLADESPKMSESTANFLQETRSKLDSAELVSHALRIRCGKPVETILHLLRTEAFDLVVVGRHADPGHFPGSTTNAVLRFATRSVLILRS